MDYLQIISIQLVLISAQIVLVIARIDHWNKKKESNHAD